jgi:hypothetical protein
VPALLRASAFWLGCHPGHLWELSYGGLVEQSARRYRHVIQHVHLSPVGALGMIVVTSRSESKLFGLDYATAKPQVLIDVTKPRDGTR